LTGQPAPLSPEELEEWEAFHYFEPWGAPAEDDRWSIAYTLTHRAHFQVDNNQVVWLDRDPQETARIAAERAAAVTLEDKMAAFFGARSVSADE
jgi:hypothetical protein